MRDRDSGNTYKITVDGIDISDNKYTVGLIDKMVKEGIRNGDIISIVSFNHFNDMSTDHVGTVEHYHNKPLEVVSFTRMFIQSWNSAINMGYNLALSTQTP